MGDDERIDLMECYTGWRPPRSYWRVSSGNGKRGPEAVEWEVKPVHGQTTWFELPRALVKNGLLEVDPNGNPSNAAEQRWERSVDRFMNDLRGKQSSMETVEERGKQLQRVIIGWKLGLNELKGEGLALCTDIGWTMAVLSRSVGGIFFPNRQPDYSWETLFNHSLVVDESFEGLDLPVETVYV